ncbi:DNA-binding proteins Bright/BRCAA1/RBP1 and proteins containing BRIGHT domain [Bachmanniomyces sp. S44760]|nr:DNA-binding proteins Bright/BRCAA1/RBP1 and proteins containing BRIGHT domain [Bachmanniomyces sp. S44760]
MAPVVNNTSSIAMALAGKTDSVDIPHPRNNTFWTGKDSFAAVAARSLPTNKHTAGLPTPPNSISPSLPPQAYKGHAAATAPPTPPAGATLVDSDIDLQDAVDHAKAQDRPQRAFALSPGYGKLASLDAAGAITPGLLAKHHLPEILLDHGPLAIRHVMGYLTTSVPGFSGIPPARARRLVVGALEGRGSNGEGGGLDGNIEFEKVGWGRWDARRRGQPFRNHSSDPRRHRSPSMTRIRTSSSSRRGSNHALRIPGQPIRHERVSRASLAPSDLASYSYKADTDMEMDSRSMLDSVNEADKMSLDGSCSSSSEAPDCNGSPVLDEDLGDVTDEEDWASIGAAALRQGSFPSKSGSGGGLYGHGLKHNTKSVHVKSGRLGGGGPASSALAKSMPMPTTSRPPPPKQSQISVLAHTSYTNKSSSITANTFAGFPNVSDSQEREAIEALLALGSV